MKNILYNNNAIIKYSDYKIIVADVDLYTFNELAKIKEDFCFINLSSDFAVNFVLEYEKIDCLMISNRMNNLNNIIIKARKKKIKIFILGKDIEYPLNPEKIQDALIKEIEGKANLAKKRVDVKKFFKKILNIGNMNYGKHDESAISKNGGNKTSLMNTKKAFGMPSHDYAIKKDIKDTDNVDLTEKNIKRDKAIKHVKKNDISGKENGLKDIDKKNKNPRLNGKSLLYHSPGMNSNNQKSVKDLKFITGEDFKNIEYQIKTIKQKIIAVAKAKGGVGGTIISIFLGLLFKKLKTLLIDLNFNEGGSDICYYLDIPKTPNLTVFTEGYDNNSFYNSILNINGNLSVIQSPLTYIQSKKIDLKDIYNLTEIARKKYDIIIFDLPNYINEFYLGIIDLADLLIMVSDCTSGSIGRLLGINEKYVYNELEKILVINKYDGFNSLKISVDMLRDYFNVKSIATLKEFDVLNAKSDFKLFDFNDFDDFRNLSSMVTEILTR